ncbi:Zinc finger, CCCH-type [Artemisia annua]|uniref:Zinc finger, CCCH-type n=1 Tax=Artemisia annua TaxID=35608 RepID=A0A2U1KEG9_ARTAN|nr:Zinc finger, CCCH-type [Artemisia annua]
MVDDRRVQRNGSSNSSVHNIEEAVRRLRIQTDGKAEGSAVTGSMAYPDRPGEPDCIFYLRTGMCGYGDSCRFNHPTHIDPVNIRTLFWNYMSRANQHVGGELPERVGEPDCVHIVFHQKFHKIGLVRLPVLDCIFYFGTLIRVRKTVT